MVDMKEAITKRDQLKAMIDLLKEEVTTVNQSLKHTVTLPSGTHMSLEIDGPWFRFMGNGVCKCEDLSVFIKTICDFTGYKPS